MIHELLQCMVFNLWEKYSRDVPYLYFTQHLIMNSQQWKLFHQPLYFICQGNLFSKARDNKDNQHYHIIAHPVIYHLEKYKCFLSKVFY